MWGDKLSNQLAHPTATRLRIGVNPNGYGWAVAGERAVLQFSARRTDAKSRWVERVRQRRGSNSAAVALAAKPARILWALLARGQEYRLAA